MIRHGCFLCFQSVLKKLIYFFSLLQINIFFNFFKSFCCADVKNNLFKKYYFNIFLNKKYLKNKYNHIFKHKIIFLKNIILIYF